MSIISEIEQIVGVAPEGYEWITYATACVILILIILFVSRFLMGIFGRHR